MLKTKIYKLPQDSTLTPFIIKEFIQMFWSDVFNPLNSNNNNMHLMIICKVLFNETELGYKTLADMRKVNFKDQDLFVEYLSERLGILSDSYTVDPVTKIIFTYIVKEGIADDSRALLVAPQYETATHKFNNMQLPLSMNPYDYGIVEVDNLIESAKVHRYTVTNHNISFIIDVSLDGAVNNVRILGVIDLAWVDTKISDNLFKRVIGKNTLFIKDGQTVVKSKQLTAKPFKNVKIDNSIINDNFMTIDIETIQIDNKFNPYLICGYTGDSYINSYAKDITIDAQNEMFIDFFKQVLANKNIKYIYAHNLSGFDGIFLMARLIKYYSTNVEPILFNGKLIAIKLKTKDRTIIFKDSYLLLPMSLRKLCKSFGVASLKSHFPFFLADINYIGQFPSFDLWSDIEYPEYLSLKLAHGEEWSFKDEAIKYCNLDCKCLFDILIKFNELVFNEFKLNIHKPLTLPALAMKIYKAHYMPKNTIYQILGNVEKDIRESYTGGAVDVYLPHNGVHQDFFSKERNKLFYYDVNSLYPFVMATLKLPIGVPIAFEGDIRSVDPEAYGFFYCKITSPENLNHPILQRKIKTADGIRTIAGLGEWEGWVFSLEMDNAINYGYQFEIIKGYKFKTGVIFKEYVEKMYSIRMKYPKTDPMNLIAKLLMNSLYGKFGMKSDTTLVEIYDTNNKEHMDNLQLNLDTFGETLQDYLQLDDFYVIIRNSKASVVYDESTDIYHGIDVSIPIAAAITAGGRIWMSQLKNERNVNLYYSDTDSVVINRELSDRLVGPGLGKFKLEYEINRAVFLAPKVYGFITNDGKEVIKIKGVRPESLKDVHVSDLEKLLIKDSKMEFNQEKWFKSLLTGNITVNEMAYQLKVTSNKRALKYHTFDIDPITGAESKIFYATRPYVYSELEKSSTAIT